MEIIDLVVTLKLTYEMSEKMFDSMTFLVLDLKIMDWWFISLPMTQ